MLFAQYLTSVTYFVIDKSTKSSVKLITRFFAIKFARLLETLNNAKILTILKFLRS